MRAGAARFTARLLAVAAILVVVGARPASADPAKPTDYQSVVTRIAPAVPGVTVKVVGGDGFLRVAADRGHVVEVLGYDGEEWLRIEADGTVKENQLSPATYLNADRYARTAAPADITKERALSSPPEFKVVGHGGVYTWHDHRIHWMSPQHPPNASAGDVIFPDWQVPIRVDGTDAVVHGRLVWEKPTTPALWFGIAVVVLVGAVVVGRGKSVTVAATVMVIGSVGALVAGIAEHASVPPAAGGSPLVVVLPAIGLGAALLGLIFRRRPVGVVAVIASVAAIVSWAIFRIAVFLKPVLPTGLNFTADRVLTAVALGFSVAAAILAVRSGGLIPRLPDLDFADDAAVEA
jgi:hypothetical protein